MTSWAQLPIDGGGGAGGGGGVAASTAARSLTAPSGTTSSNNDGLTGDDHEFETHVVLRLPIDVAEQLHAACADVEAKPDLQIAFTSLRAAEVRLFDEVLPARIFDLPTISEVHKTIDKKNVYKVGDVSQIIVAKHKADADVSERQLEEKLKAAESSGRALKKNPFGWAHGLTPPLKSCRRRRFRKTKRKKFMEAPEVDQELKRLLRADLEAVSSRWEIVTQEEKKPTVVTEAQLFGSGVSSSDDEEDTQAESRAAHDAGVVVGDDDDDESSRQGGADASVGIPAGSPDTTSLTVPAVHQSSEPLGPVSFPTDMRKD